jgi:predicted unusual protein kinase regulating ubiquinone biosynthesis (AarF/ABC1/UbiB family)
MSREKPLPTGRVGRFVRLAGLGARTGASLALSKDGAGAAKHALEVLGTLRGLSAKVGQMASYVDGFVPEAHRAAYEAALSSLRIAAPTSDPEAIRRLVEQELGGTIEQLFAEWQSEPFASASIGQVHRARLLDGREVAVKVQHPGIDRAVESDLQNASVIPSIIGTVLPRDVGARGMFQAIEQRFREELDYESEATWQERFSELHQADPTIRIPRVVRERSSRRVLTTELAVGRLLEEVAADPPDRRRRYAEALWRFVFKGNLVGGMFNADPHPGNYLFQDDGGVVFLDFGCIQPLSAETRLHGRGMHRAALARDEAKFREHVRGILRTRGGSYEAASVAFSRRAFEPLFASPFHMTRAFVAGLIEQIVTMKRTMLAKDRSFVPLPPELVLMNRLQFGFYSVLARLDVEVDYAGVEREFLAEAGL